MLRNPAAFFSFLRESSLFAHHFSQDQVDGITRELDAFSKACWPLAWAACGLATSYWETGHRMQPVPEAGRGRGKPYGIPDETGKAPYGRGEVQTTWRSNYLKMDAALDLGGTLAADYDRMLEPDISTAALVVGMQRGLFTGCALKDYLHSDRPGSRTEFINSRRIINGSDRAAIIADIALTFQTALQHGVWSTAI